MNTRRPWLEAVPWDSIVTLNKALCQAKELTSGPSVRAAEVQAFWERRHRETMTLRDAIDTCRQCLAKAPFTLYNANTFTAIAKTMMDDWLKPVPPVEAQIIRTTVAHFIAGQIQERELTSVFKHYGALLERASTRGAGAAPSAPTAAAGAAAPQRSATVSAA